MRKTKDADYLGKGRDNKFLHGGESGRGGALEREKHEVKRKGKHPLLGGDIRRKGVKLVCAARLMRL